MVSVWNDLTVLAAALHRHPEYRDCFDVGASLDEHIRWAA